ncbi:unnamed protein product [Notodromas monacha]|uniref:Uncharacterized protein n=1 Tax=Notodromas monacha TaxID=399045 RepID=A0A7R9GD55_9CRUS|nr:unnamed protein product [Notodromas monacha]CAG0916563.1 unnamed protein product [Notodromas monacha]
MAGFVVAIRNDNLLAQDTQVINEYKCRIFHHTISIANSVLATTHRYDSNGGTFFMKCPPGTMSALYDDDGHPKDHQAVTYIRCNTLELPWKVDNTNCHSIELFRNLGNATLSWMNDPGLKKTADEVWGAECGDKNNMEAMVMLDLHDSANFRVERIQCCKVIKV